MTRSAFQMDSDPMHSGPVGSGPVGSDPMRSDSMHADPIRSDPIHADPMRSEPMQTDTAARPAPAFAALGARATATYLLTVKIMADNMRRWYDLQAQTAAAIVRSARCNADAVTTAEAFPALSALSCTRIADTLTCSLGFWQACVATDRQNRGSMLAFFSDTQEFWGTPAAQATQKRCYNPNPVNPVPEHADARAGNAAQSPAGGTNRSANRATAAMAAAAARRAIVAAKSPDGTPRQDGPSAAKPAAL